MKNQRFIIIDDDALVRTIIQRSIQDQDSTCTITSEETPEAGLDQIANEVFDVVIADLDVIIANGNLWGNLWDSRGLVHPTIVATSQSEAQPDGTYLPVKYVIVKPIDLSNLDDVTMHLLNKKDGFDLDKLNQAEALYKKVSIRMDALLADTSARCILLCDPAGRIINQIGDTRGLSIDAITSLISGGMATLLEAGKNLDEAGVINLLYREGKQADLYGINIHDDWILIIVIDRGTLFQRLGTVWFYARKAAVDLNTVREELNKVQPVAAAEGHMNQAYTEELDKLFR
jgi:hypothetical protein